MGRLKGSKNKIKENFNCTGCGIQIIRVHGNTEPIAPSNGEGLCLACRDKAPAVKRGRGRPKGSLGKPKALPVTETAIPQDPKELKRQIRMLRKIKKDTHKKTDERRELNEKIRTLKNRLLPITMIISPEKADIIHKILERRPEYVTLNMNLEKYSVEQLNAHYERILHKPRLF